MGSGNTPGPVQVRGFFGLLLGPIRILGPFHRMTLGAEPALRRRLAIRGFAFATASCCWPAPWACRRCAITPCRRRCWR
jgi:hypothetical protein